MIVEQKPLPFHPVTITLTTEEELNTFLNICEAAAEHARQGNVADDGGVLIMANDMHNRVLNPHCEVINPKD